MDGRVEARYHHGPYHQRHEPKIPREQPLVSPENMAAVCTQAASQGWQVGTHCVGDAGIDLIMGAYGAANRSTSISGRRWRLIHMMAAHPEQFETANQLGLIVTAQQPSMYTLDNGFQ